MFISKLLCGTAIVLVSAAVAGSAGAKESFKTFDPTGSTSTYAAGIDASGTVAGYYYDSQSVTHGFLRTSDGTIMSFDPPGSTETQVTGINDKGEIAGSYRDGSGTWYSFVRAADGTVTKFNPTSGNEPGMIGINAREKVAGWYTSDGGQQAGFVGSPGGRIKQLTVEGDAINSKGVVTGTDGTEGFVRSPSGKMVTFKAPNNPGLTVPTAINDSNVVGGFGSTVCGRSHGFSRSAGGNVTTVEPSGAELSKVLGINDKGDMTGAYYSGGYHGFVRSHNGTYKSFDISGDTYGTFSQGINTKGEVTGEYWDSSGLPHGFVGTP